jgi:hypothetical protein
MGIIEIDITVALTQTYLKGYVQASRKQVLGGDDCMDIPMKNSKVNEI